MRISSFFLGLLLCLQAQAISRIGKSSIIDPVEGFTAPVNEDFVIARPLADDGLLISTPYLGLGGRMGRPNELRFTRFRVQFPEFAVLSQRELAVAMESNYPNWKSYETYISCISIFAIHDAGASAAFATWGDGHGVAIVAGPSEVEWQAILISILQIQLDEVGCRWK